MIKREFLDELRDRLQTLPPSEIDRAVQFYSEQIDGRKQEGLTEPEAVAAVGDLDAIVDEILAAARSGQPVEYRRRKPDVRLALLILGSPMWFVMIALGICIWFMLLLALWLMVLAGWVAALLLEIGVGAALFAALAALWALAIALSAGGAACCFSAPSLWTQDWTAALLRAGAGLAGLGLGMRMLPALRPAARALWRGCKGAISRIHRGMAFLTRGAWRLCGRSLIAFKRRFIDGEGK